MEIVTSVPKPQLVDLCQKYGATLNVPTGIDGPQLMWALSGNESSFGANCQPRHEPAYDRGGLYAGNPEMATMLVRYGWKAACSYGPWQVMAVNAPGFSPDDLASDPEDCAEASADFINRIVFAKWKATTLAQVGQIYNGGHPMQHPPLGVQSYVQRLIMNYAVPMLSGTTNS